MADQALFWVGFNIFILLMLALDLGVFHRRSHVIGFREAVFWSVFWVALALIFNLFIYFVRDASFALAFFTGYLLEKSLSLDNIFVIAVLFSSLNIPVQYQHRILFWGIIGALVMRAIMIWLGVELLERFHWMPYVLGAILLFSALETIRSIQEKAPNFKIEQWFGHLKKYLPLTSTVHGNRFFIKESGRWIATPLFAALVLIECADALFAIDSIPAILAISRDQFIVYTSNVFAILGLRSLYFLLAHILPRFYYLKHALGLILGFAGIKIIVSEWISIPVWIVLSFIAVSLSSAIILSLLKKKSPADKHAGIHS